MSKCKHLFLLFTLFLFTGLSINAVAGPIIVPNVVNQPQATAETTITEAGLTVGAITPANDDSIISGNVISQIPAADDVAQADDPVALVISTGPAPVTVPGVVGKTQAVATANIEAVGLVVALTEVNSDTVLLGIVISQTPTGGDPAAPGSTVNIVVSLGPAGPGSVTVPDVVGKTLAAATSDIEAVGLVVASTDANSDSVLAGNVISQTPTGGNSALVGSTVNIVVSTGPAPVTVPDVVGRTEAVATSDIEAVGLVVASTNANSDSVTAGNIISQTPTGGSSAAVGSTVNIVVSTGAAPVTVPGVVGRTQAVATSDIEAVGLVVASTNANSDSVPAGNIISQTPTGGSSAAVGSAVNIVVSLGAAPVTVPGVVGKAQAVATADIEAVGLVVASTEANSDSVLLGNVISQTPAGGSSAAVGSTVNIVVSLGPAGPGSVTVPGVVGKTLAAATTDIEAVGLVVASTEANSDTEPVGNVISQTPTGGNAATVGSTVNIVVSLGPAIPGTVTVPDVVEKTLAAATTAIEAVGLVVASTEANSDSVPAGSVISQTPTGGTTADTGSTVNIVVSTGPAPATVPDVVGMTEAEATTAIEAVDLVVDTQSASSETVLVGDVISQDPAGGSSVPPRSTVTIVISTGLQSIEVPLAGSNNTVTITTEPGEEITDVSTAEAAGGPSGINFPFGTISYTTSSADGGSVVMKFVFSTDLPDDLVVYKVDDNGVYTELPAAIWTQIDARTVDVTVTDGDPVTDQDGVVNGFIKDPIAVGGVQSTGGGGDDDDDGDLFDFGGGGCTISNTQSASMDPIWLLMLLVPGLGVMRRRVAATGNTSRGRN